MSTSFNTHKDLTTVMFYDASANTYTTRDLTTGDYFADDVAVGDILYFGLTSDIFNDIFVNVGTARDGTITGVWEYEMRWAGMPWQTVTVTDDTNLFSTLGANAIKFDPLALNDWENVTVNGLNRWWIRFRVLSVSGVSEGGANSTTAMQCGDHIIHLDETKSFAQLYALDLANGWGVIKRTHTYLGDIYHTVFTLGCRIAVEGSGALVDTAILSADYGAGLGIEILCPWAGYNQHNGIVAASGTTVTLGTYDATNLYSKYSVLLTQTRAYAASGGVATLDLDGTVNFYGVNIPQLTYMILDVSKTDAVTIKDSFIGKFSAIPSGITANKTDWYTYGNTNWNLKNGSYITNGLWLLQDNGVYPGFAVANGRGGARDYTIRAINASSMTMGYLGVSTGILEFIDCVFEGNLTFAVRAGYNHLIYKSASYDMHLEDSNGNNVPGATVTMVNSDNEQVFSVVTDANGNIDEQIVPYEITNQYGTTEKSFTLTIAKEGYPTITKHITAAQLKVRLREQQLSAEKRIGYAYII